MFILLKFFKFPIEGFGFNKDGLFGLQYVPACKLQNDFFSAALVYHTALFCNSNLSFIHTQSAINKTNTNLAFIDDKT